MEEDGEDDDADAGNGRATEEGEEGDDEAKICGRGGRRLTPPLVLFIVLLLTLLV